VILPWRGVLALVVGMTCAGVVGGGPAAAQTPDQTAPPSPTAPPAVPAAPGNAVVAGGGSLSNQIVPLPRGGSIGPIHTVYLINRTAVPLAAEWYQAVPSGMTITPSVRRVQLAPGENTTVVYSVKTDPSMVVGDYAVQVGLNIVNTNPATGDVTFVPGFRSDWTLRVVESKAQIRVRLEGGRASDVVSLSRVNDTSSFEMARGEGTSLREVVAPGMWRAQAEREGRPLGNRSLVIGDDQRLQVVLNVRTGQSSVGAEDSSSWFTSGWLWFVLGLLGGAGAVVGLGAWRRRKAGSGAANEPQEFLTEGFSSEPSGR